MSFVWSLSAFWRRSYVLQAYPVMEDFFTVSVNSAVKAPFLRLLIILQFKSSCLLYFYCLVVTWRCSPFGFVRCVTSRSTNAFLFSTSALSNAQSVDFPVSVVYASKIVPCPANRFCQSREFSSEAWEISSFLVCNQNFQMITKKKTRLLTLVSFHTT